MVSGRVFCDTRDPRYRRPSTRDKWTSRGDPWTRGELSPGEITESPSTVRGSPLVPDPSYEVVVLQSRDERLPLSFPPCSLRWRTSPFLLVPVSDCENDREG